jgi:hypothetical protein
VNRRRRNYSIAFENLLKFKYLGTKAKEQNCVPSAPKHTSIKGHRTII